MNITLTGNLGSGKSSVCAELRKMGYPIVSTGSIFREIAKEKNMSVIELNELAKKDRSIDDLIDHRTTQLGKQLDNTIFDSRLAWNFIPDSFKVFLLVDVEESAKRVFEGGNRDAETYTSMEDTLNGLVKRADLEQKRFKELYGINYYDMSNYDLVIESTAATPEQIANEIITQFKLYCEKPFPTKVELNLKNLYPTQSFADFNGNWLNTIYDKESKSKSLCMEESVPLTIKNGYNYILDGHHHAFASLAAGKIFAQVRSIKELTSENVIIPLSKKDLYDFEDLGRFSYKTYPDEKNIKKGYKADFSTLYSADRNKNVNYSKDDFSESPEVEL